MNANHLLNSLRNDLPGDVRYTKEQLIVLYKQQREAGALDHTLSAIFTGGWNPLDAAEFSNSAWGRRDEGKDPVVGPEVCWDHNPGPEPLALVEMSEDEREVRHGLRMNAKPETDPNSVVFLIRQLTNQTASKYFQG